MRHMNQKTREFLTKVGCFMYPVVQSVAISVGVYYVIRGINSVFDRR